MDTVDIFKKALEKAVDSEDASSSQLFFNEDKTIQDLYEICSENSISFADVLSFAAVNAYKEHNSIGRRVFRESLNFIVNNRRTESTLMCAKDVCVDVKLAYKALKNANKKIELIHDLSISNNVEIFELLGLRNLSAFVGEIFANELHLLSDGLLIRNPNQDGYPDLLAMNKEGRNYFEERKRNHEISDKTFWSPFPHGGIEVKATCGNTPNAKVVPKPKIGESRYPLLVSAEWKAHHRETNNLVGIFWDFIDELPTVLAVFYRNDLTEEDWGKIIQPREGGGRTTSVSIMVKGTLENRIGVKKMGAGWLVLPKDKNILSALAQKKVFAIPV